MEKWATYLLAFGFAFIHFSSKYMKFLEIVPRSKLLSAAGGISIAYVFLRLLPELSEYQTASIPSAVFETEIYVWAMAGLAVFYGLDKISSAAVQNHNKQQTNSLIFWVHISSFALYNILIGYLLIREEYQGLKSLVFYFIAMSVHFISNDHGLRETHREAYDKQGRWLLSLAVLAGAFLGIFNELNDSLIAVLFAFLAGGIILNVMKEELPEEKESNFLAFFVGLVLYSSLLLLI